MAWNEPGGGKNRDPWGNRGDDGGPPDLDEVVRKVKNRLRSLFGKGGGQPPGKRDTGSGGSGSGLSPLLAWIVLALAAVVWLASGFFVTDAADRSVVTRFGAFESEVGPGPHWHWPWPIGQVRTINVAENRSLTIDTESMLTQDENVVVLDMSVQYDVKDVKAFLFNVNSPERTLHQVIESELRAVAGDRDMDAIITKKRGEVASRIQRQGQEIIDSYGTGLNIQAVNLEQAQPPDPVQPAYQDAIKAREDQKRFVNKARAVRNRIIPKARGQKAETVQQARAYRTRVVESAQGDVKRYLSDL